MHYRRYSIVLVVLTIAAVSLYGYVHQQDANIRDDMEVTLGELEQVEAKRFLVTVPQMRAYFTGSNGNTAHIDFIYRGPTEDIVPLASGEHRQQLGLKLRAQDTCNTLYIMWRIQPTEDIIVSAKRNPSEHTHDACGAAGYSIITPEYGASAEPLQTGEPRSLSAELIGNDLSVFIDDSIVWQGTIPAELLAPRGQAGMRSDNVIFEMTPSWGSE